MTQTDWPASNEALAAAREFINRHCRQGRVVVAYHGDVDGLSAAVLTERALHRLGNSDAVDMPAGKGESIHTPAMLARVAGERPDALVILDMGSRGGPLLDGMPTLVVDHHAPAGRPGVSVFLSAAGHPPVAPTSLLAFELFNALVDLEDVAWLAAMGVIADLGANHPFEALQPVIRCHGATAIREAVSLLNAAKRAPAHDVATAHAVLAATSSPSQIARGQNEEIARLRAYRDEVKREVDRCARTAPVFAGQVALLRFSSAAQVHPLVAVRWINRLRDSIVVAANDGYIPGRVNFSVRSANDVNLIAFLQSVRPPGLEGDFAFGHERATGGSLPTAEFERLLERIGFRRAA